MCGGFVCSKNSLAALNVLFLLVSFLLIGVASYAKAAAVITSFQVVGGIIASGVFLFLVAFLGLIAGTKHHQVLLFFYIVVLFLIFVIQFSVSIACLAISETQVESTLSTIWHANTTVTEELIKNAENGFNCCGWDETANLTETYNTCMENGVCGVGDQPECSSLVMCGEFISGTVSGVLEATGGIGLFFSFTEMLGVWLAVRFRNQKDPLANPNQFL